jgi:hypothetical protein
MSLSVKIKIPQLPKLIKALKDHPKIVAPFVQEAIVNSINKIDREASVITPRDTGELIKSLGRDKEFKPLMGVIQSKKNYALYQHENLTYRHPKGGQAKFLSIGTERSKGSIAGFFREAYDKSFKGIKGRIN